MNTATTLPAPQNADPSWRVIVVAILIVQVIGFAVGAAFGPQPGGWYFQIEKSPLNPPPLVFPIAWTLLYAMIGWAGARIWTLRGAPGGARAFGLFVVQLLLNFGWSVVFFGLQALWPAVAYTIVFLAAVIAATVAMGRVDRLSGWLMAPYVAWVAFALFLTYEVARLNT